MQWETPYVLHGVKLKKNCTHGNNNNKQRREEVACISINTGSDIISMCIVLVQIRQRESSKVLQTYALLDSYNQGTFILDQLTKDLGISRRQTSNTIKLINGEYTNISLAIEDLQVANISNHTSEWLPLLKTITRSKLQVDNGDITNPAQLKQ